MTRLPELAPERLSKQELLRLLDKVDWAYYPAIHGVRYAAFRVREESLWEDYEAKAAASSAASDKVQAVPIEHSALFYEAMAESCRCREVAQSAWLKYKTFSDQRRDSSEAVP